MLPSVLIYHSELKSSPSCAWLEKSSCCWKLQCWSTSTRGKNNNNSPHSGPQQRLSVFTSPLFKQGFGFLHLSSALPHHSLLCLLSSVRNPPRFPSNPHKSICYFPSPLLPIPSLFIQLSLFLFFISSPLLLITLLTSGPTVINLTVWYGTA